MTCKDCIHYDVCYKKPDHFDDLSVNGGCIDFADKSRFIELPCKVGDKVWYIHKEKIYCQSVSKRNIYSIATSGKLGHSLFLSREEAGKALKERESR